MENKSQLTRAEQRVLQALVAGKLYKEIGAEYNITLNTVKKHMKNIYRKLGMHKRTVVMQHFHQDPTIAQVVQYPNHAPIYL